MVLLTQQLAEPWRFHNPRFNKWRDRPPTPRQTRRARLDEAVKASFDDSGGTPGTYGFTESVGRPDRKRLGGVEEYGGFLDGPPGRLRPNPETQTTGHIFFISLT